MGVPEDVYVLSMEQYLQRFWPQFTELMLVFESLKSSLLEMQASSQNIDPNSDHGLV
jgi:hypothetical protein